MEKVTIRFYAAARDAAGFAEMQVSHGPLQEILRGISHENARLAHVLERCSFLVDGTIQHDQGIEILAGSTVDVLPPFAGG